MILHRGQNIFSDLRKDLSSAQNGKQDQSTLSNVQLNKNDAYQMTHIPTPSLPKRFYLKSNIFNTKIHQAKMNSSEFKPQGNPKKDRKI